MESWYDMIKYNDEPNGDVNMLSEPMTLYKSVSYTHLDVYKRQVYGLAVD